MAEGLAASYIALKLENEMLQAQVQRLMKENAALQAQIPELQKPQAAKEDELAQKPTEAQELPKPSGPLETPAAWDHTNPPESEEPQKPRELPIDHGLLATCVSQKSPEAKELEKSPMALDVHRPLEVKEAQVSPDTKDDLEAQEAQNLELQDLSNVQDPLETPECQISTHLEPLELCAPQKPLQSCMPQAPLGVSDAQEFLELSAPQESLEGLMAVETSTASEFPQSPSGLEAEAFPLERPLAFNGNSQKFPGFLVQLRVRGHLYPTEAALVSFVSNCFSGEAGKWFQLLVYIQRPLLEQFESFIRVLRDTFNNPENMEDANHHMHPVCQGEDPVHQDVTHLHLIAQELNWDESTLCIQFQESLASSIRDELSPTNSATNLSYLITQCNGLEEKLNVKPDPNAQGKSPSEERGRPENQPGENRPVQAASNRPHLSKAERARRREGHLCLYCAHPGHFARDCPVKLHRAQPAGNIQARR